MPADPTQRRAASHGPQSIQRALQLVRIVAGQGRRGLRIQDLTRASGLAPTTVFRIVQGLMSEGVLEREPRSHKLYLGRLVHELGLAARQTPLHETCRETLRDVARQNGSVVYLSDRSGTEAVCVDRALDERIASPWALDVGLRSPLGLGVGGLAILAALGDDAVEEIVAANATRYQEHGGLTPAALWRGVRQARARGYARRRSLMVPGVAAIGVSFRYGHSVASMTISALAGQLDGRRATHAIETLQRARERIERMQDAGTDETGR